MNTLNFIIIDDTVSYRQILRQMIAMHADWSVVGEGDNGLVATQLVAAKRPDVVLIDINMPLMNGIEATRQIKQMAPRTRVIIFSGYDDKEFRHESLRVGADYYLPKEELDAKQLTRLIGLLFPNGGIR